MFSAISIYTKASAGMAVLKEEVFDKSFIEN
jgi:hypothetical protein